MPQFARYSTPTGLLWGLVIDNVIHEWDGDPLAAPAQLTPGEALFAVDDAPLAAPATPSKIVAVGRNYAAHAAEHQADVPDEPMLFLKPSTAILAPGAAIQIPAGIGRVDEEAELAVIIGRTARNVRREDALDYVLGYTCANDVSARVFQKKDGQWGRAKGFDTFCPLGPIINTDLDPSDLLVRGWIGERMVQEDRTSSMVFDVPALIEFISGVMTLLPGDVILTGTPAGVSELHDGDTVRIEIEGIGTLKNGVRVGE